MVNKSEDHALVLGSAQNTVIGSFEGGSPPPQGSKLYLRFKSWDWIYEDLTVINVDIDVGGNLAIGTLGDLRITESKINVEEIVIVIMFICTPKIYSALMI